MNHPMPHIGTLKLGTGETGVVLLNHRREPYIEHGADNAEARPGEETAGITAVGAGVQGRPGHT